MDVGRWLVEYRAKMDKAEALWLERLAQFDWEGAWALDGQLSCVGWLVWRLRMSRATAFEKVRVAHELTRRPVVSNGSLWTSLHGRLADRAHFRFVGGTESQRDQSRRLDGHGSHRFVARR